MAAKSGFPFKMYFLTLIMLRKIKFFHHQQIIRGIMPNTSCIIVQLRPRFVLKQNSKSIFQNLKRELPYDIAYLWPLGIHYVIFNKSICHTLVIDGEKHKSQ